MPATTRTDTPSFHLPVEIRRPDAEKLFAFADAVRGDPELRSSIESDPRAVLAEHGLPVPPSPGVRIVLNTSEIFHVVFPPDPNVTLSDEALAFVAGGQTVGSGGSASTIGTLGTAGSTVSCAGTASSAGTAGSVGDR